jgi:hypothetical protein
MNRQDSPFQPQPQFNDLLAYLNFIQA